jgi:hypothetical protein
MKMTLIHSSTGGLNRNLIDFTSTGRLELNELTIQQDESIYYKFNFNLFFFIVL